MVETVLLRCSLVLGEVSSCIVPKIITGPQSNKSLVLGEKPVLLFKMEHSPSSSKPGLPCEKPGRSTAQSCAFCFSPWNYFAHQGQPQKERDSTLCWRLWKLCHLSCASAQEQILLLSGGGNRYAPGYQNSHWSLPCPAVCWSCAVSRVLCSSQGEALFEGVHYIIISGT